MINQRAALITITRLSVDNMNFLYSVLLESPPRLWHSYLSDLLIQTWIKLLHRTSFFGSFGFLIHVEINRPYMIVFILFRSTSDLFYLFTREKDNDLKKKKNFDAPLLQNRGLRLSFVSFKMLTFLMNYLLCSFPYQWSILL